MDSLCLDAHLLFAAFLDRAFDERGLHSLLYVQMPTQLAGDRIQKTFRMQLLSPVSLLSRVSRRMVNFYIRLIRDDFNFVIALFWMC